MSRHIRTLSSAAVAFATAVSLICTVPPATANTDADAGSAEAEDLIPFPLRPDFNGDSHADLAVGVRGENLGADNQGAVNVIYGSPSGLTATENQLWSQDVPGVLGTGEAQDSFGKAVGLGRLRRRWV